MTNSPLWRLTLVALALIGSACASGRGPDGSGDRSGLYSMPADLADALRPQDADPSNAAQLAESALSLLNPDQPGGPNFLGAARMCLLAAETADPRVERELRQACYGVAARSALRSGDSQSYLDAVDLWEADATRGERESGELAVHRAIRNRLRGASKRDSVHLPAGVARLIPPPTESSQ